MKGLNKDWLLIGSGALLALSVLAINFFNSNPLFLEKNAEVLDVNSDCDLQTMACSLKLPGAGSVQLELAPRPVKPVEEIQISVLVKQQAASKVVVDFRGVSMNMGMNRFELEQKSNGLFQGKGILPVCVRSKMDWEAQVMLQLPTGIVIAPFRFATFKKY